LSVSRVGGAAQTKAMKQVAGRLRLDLAQYRELEAFAKFGSDLDKATQAQLNRGVRLVELLKQPQYQPMDAEKMIVSLYSGTRGYLDSLPIEKVAEYESQMLSFVERKYPEILSEIKEKMVLSDELDEKMKNALEEFAQVFQAA
jgi:F-type H+-transporting ATPase subunit alpha